MDRETLYIENGAEHDIPLHSRVRVTGHESLKEV